jgi:hypothetical protein
MKYVIAMSGPVAVGKTALTKEIEKRFMTYRISTRQFLAGDYGVLVRVGGPNAGHNVAFPRYNYPTVSDPRWRRVG